MTARDRALKTAASVTRTFVVDTGDPLGPPNLRDITIVSDDVVRTFQWDRSTDTGFVALGSLLNTGSGVLSYNVVIAGPVNITEKTGDSFRDPATNTCTFVTPELIPGGYTISVNAVDRATNTSDFVTLEFRAGPAGVVANLRLIDPVFGNTVATSDPVFRWNPPELDLQQVDLITYEVAITGDLSTLPETADLRIFSPFRACPINSLSGGLAKQ